jgi:hypothetical protein
VSKPSIIPSWKYQKPSKGGHKGLKKLLKYVSHRESPDHRPVDLEDRWVDCGLGANWREVYASAGQLAGPYVLAHHLVISPAPDLMQHLPEALRHDVVREVTERTIEQWHVNRGLSVPEYSYCVHDRDTNGDYGLQQLHTHVFVAGTIDNGLGERLSHRVDREQVCADRGGLEREDNLHHVARHEFEQILDRTLGIEWRHEREQALNRDLSRPEIEPAVTPEPEPVDHDDDLHDVTRFSFKHLLDQTQDIEQRPEREQDLNPENELAVALEPEPVDDDDHLRDDALREFQRLRDRGLRDEWRPEPGINMDQAHQAFRQLLDRILGIERQREHEPDVNQESVPAVTPEPVDLDDTEEGITLHLEIDWMTEMLLDPDGEGWRSLISGDTAPSGPERDHNRGRSAEIEAPAPDSDESIGRGWDMDR